MSEHRHLIAILRGITPEEIDGIVGCLIEAGIYYIEVPLNSPRVFESIAHAAERFGSRAMIGAGTVLTEGDVKSVADTGAKFVVSPDCSEPVISLTRALQMESYPGVFTPSEAFRAIRAGAHGLKFFPAEVLGPQGIAAMKAVLPPDIPLYAVGGANPDNFDQYRAAGCAGFGLGSYLYKPGRPVEEVAAAARAAVTAYDQLGN